jgi:hypothetical protein
MRAWEPQHANLRHAWAAIQGNAAGAQAIGKCCSPREDAHDHSDGRRLGRRAFSGGRARTRGFRPGGGVGTWVLVSNSDKNSDGSPKWGNDPKGSLIFEANGRYSFMIVRSDLPKFAANAADKGTAEENASVVRGSFANFGTFTVDEEKKTFTTKIEASVYPNITGLSMTRTITALGPDELRYTNATTATGASADVVWRRIGATH